MIYMVVSKKIWGPAFWIVMYTVAENYSDNPNTEEKRIVTAFIENMSKVIPCDECRAHFSIHLKSNPLLAGSRNKTTLLNWVNKLHNSVNTKIGKPTESVSQVLQEMGVENPQPVALSHPIAKLQSVAPSRPTSRARVVARAQPRVAIKPVEPKQVHHQPQQSVKSMGIIKSDGKPRRKKCNCH